MGIFDAIVSGVLGGGGASSPMGNVLSSILSGANQAGGSGGGSGLVGLLSQLRQAGLGSQVDSWIGQGQNQPVSPQQLGNAFGEQQVGNWASQAGMQPHDFLSQLSQHLPRAVDAATPDGGPPEGQMSV